MTALLRTLPKQLRRGLVPIPDRVREVLPHIDPGEPLLPALERELRRATAVTIPPDAWAPDQVPDHLRATFRVLDDQQRPLAVGKDLAALKAQVAPQARASLARAASDARAHRADVVGVRHPAAARSRCSAAPTWSPRSRRWSTRGRPSASASSPPRPRRSRLTWRGARRLLVLVAGSPARQIVKTLSPRTRLALQFNPDGEIPDLVADCVDAAADELIAAAGGPPRDEAAFAALVATARTELHRAHRRHRAEGGGRAHPGPRGGRRDRRGAGTAGARGRDRRPAAADGRPAAPRVRRRHRPAPAAGRRPLPQGDGAPAGEAAGQRRPRRALDARRSPRSPPSTSSCARRCRPPAPPTTR